MMLKEIDTPLGLDPPITLEFIDSEVLPKYPSIWRYACLGFQLSVDELKDLIRRGEISESKFFFIAHLGYLFLVDIGQEPPLNSSRVNGGAANDK